MNIRILHAFMLLCMCFSVVELAAQTMQVRGRVTSAVNQEPSAGVTVSVKGSTVATSTDASGHYAIEVPAQGATLVFRQLGMHAAEVEVTSAGTYDVQLQENEGELEEVVVVGYGTQKKSGNSILHVFARPISQYTGSVYGSSGLFRNYSNVAAISYIASS